MRSVFHDRHDRLAYLKACAVARRLRAEPSLVAAGRTHLERFIAPNPHAQAALAAWRTLLEGPASSIADALEEDSARGQ
jgi:hypothetical protein